MTTKTHLFISPVLGLFVLLGLAACSSSGPVIFANADPSADFTSYRTYGYTSPLSTDRNGVRSVLSSYLMNAATVEMNARGYQQVQSNPDLLINFVVATKQTLQSRSQPTTSVGMRGGSAGRGMSVGVSSGTQVTQKTEGTLTVVLIDPARKQVVWEASATGRITDKVQNNLEEVSNAAVAEMFQLFPVQPLNAASSK
jgi:hypothetical protein